MDWYEPTYLEENTNQEWSLSERDWIDPQITTTRRNVAFNSAMSMTSGQPIRRAVNLNKFEWIDSLDELLNTIHYDRFCSRKSKAARRSKKSY